ncbi:hypothetical protein NC653_014245 [Populus alba x Populus x berolinensis]|uniref:Uncharacterized protein n=1 Tax=Populus alba x Populus x berolinensis TaxID=444605 RepID=A0AAD6QWK5_9ROSI|nr:hypothetical protein NC653_014245 [Populus alba x Populus x berolinensis]
MLEQHYVSFSWKDLEDEFAIQFNKIVELNKRDERKNKDSLKLQHLKLRLFFDPGKLLGRYKQSQITFTNKMIQKGQATEIQECTFMAIAPRKFSVALSGSPKFNCALSRVIHA